MPFGDEQYIEYLKLALEPTNEKEYIKKAWETILPENKIICKKHKDEGYKNPLPECSDCTRYHISMIEKTVSNLISTGFLVKQKNNILLPEHSLNYLNNSNKNSFSELVLDALEFSWGKPDGDQIAVEAIIDILSKLPKNNEDYIGQKAFLRQISEESDSINGYDIDNVNTDRTLRELLKLLEFGKAVVTDGSGKYKLNTSSEVESIRKRFRKISYLNIAENTIDILGSNHEVLDSDFIMALSKYYIYRHSGGIGRQSGLIKILLKEMERAHEVLLNDYYKKDAKRYNFGASKGINIENTAKNYRNKLARQIAKNCGVNTDEPLFKYNLSRFPITSLIRLEAYNNVDDLKKAMKTSKGKFDRAILDIIMHKDGEFKLPNNFKLFSNWQKEAVDDWIKNIPERNHEAYSGIVSAVTGSGKTIMALMAIQEYLKQNPTAIISVIVPTKVLMYQWATEIAKLLGLPSSKIGLRGDGFKDSFYDGKRIVVSIVNSAIREEYLKNDIKLIPENIKHFLIADECHRYGGQEFNRVFDCGIDAKLGLSATPPADNQNQDNTQKKNEQNEVINALGSEFYQLNYNKARQLNLICEFKIKYIAVHLTPKKKIEYDSLTKAIAKSLEKIRLIYGHRLDAMKLESLHQKLQIILNNDENPDPSISKFFSLAKERRDVVNDSYERKSCFTYLIKNALASKENKKIMIFHERISQLEEIISSDKRVESSEIERETYNELQNMLSRKYYKPVMYHSQQDQKWNSWAMDWFRKDYANTMISVKALVEGVDVPSADLGIVRVSSSSVRQRIQTIGRVLRKGRDKSAEIYVLFVKDTVDENIFKSYDWNEELGMSAIEYFEWDEINKELVKRDKHELPQPMDYEDNLPPLEVEVDGLNPGDKYPGRFAGDLYHVSADGNPYKRTSFGRIIINNKDMIKAAQMIKTMKGGGKIIITPQGNIVTRIKEKGTIFLGTTDYELIREETSVKIEEFKKSKNKKRKFKKPPTFQELFGS